MRIVSSSAKDLIYLWKLLDRDVPFVVLEIVQSGDKCFSTSAPAVTQRGVVERCATKTTRSLNKAWWSVDISNIDQPPRGENSISWTTAVSFSTLFKPFSCEF